MLPSAPGVWDQVLHCIPHSGHAEGSLRPHEEGKVPDAGDDVRSRTRAPAEGEKKERTAVSPWVALALPQCLHYTPHSSQAQPPLPLFMYFSLESFSQLILYTKDTLFSDQPVWLQPKLRPWPRPHHLFRELLLVSASYPLCPAPILNLAASSRSPLGLCCEMALLRKPLQLQSLLCRSRAAEHHCLLLASILQSSLCGS